MVLKSSGWGAILGRCFFRMARSLALAGVAGVAGVAGESHGSLALAVRCLLSALSTS